MKIIQNSERSIIAGKEFVMQIMQIAVLRRQAIARVAIDCNYPANNNACKLEVM
jgi:hypothetical protein